VKGTLDLANVREDALVWIRIYLHISHQLLEKEDIYKPIHKLPEVL
jgi:hypothetical protein